jgi:hypothetical protein
MSFDVNFNGLVGYNNKQHQYQGIAVFQMNRFFMAIAKIL